MTLQLGCYFGYDLIFKKNFLFFDMIALESNVTSVSYTSLLLLLSLKMLIQIKHLFKNIKWLKFRFLWSGPTHNKTFHKDAFINLGLNLGVINTER